MSIDKIESLRNKESGSYITIKVVVLEVKLLKKKDGVTPYISLVAQDNSGTIEFPIWSEYEVRSKALVEGVVVDVSGALKFYEGKPQVDKPAFSLHQDANVSECIPSYDIPTDLMDYFGNVVINMSDKYKRFAIAATGCFDSGPAMWELFTQAPSAKGHHGNKIGGLFLHSMGLLKNVESIIDLYVNNPFHTDASSQINGDRLRLKAIIHDIGKVWEYEWKSGIKRKKIVRDHIMMTVSYIERLNIELKLFDEEELDNICASVMTHHGNYSTYGKSELKTVEDHLLHLADMIDSRIVGAAESHENP